MGKKRQPDWDEAAAPVVNARLRLPRLLVRYVAKGRRLLEGNPTPARLHRLRLATKRLRYTFELFTPCYGPAFESRLGVLRGLQQCLGEINDCATLRALVGPRMAPGSPPWRAVDRLLEERMAKAAGALRSQWHEAFEAPGRLRAWELSLRRTRRAVQ